MFPGLQGNPHWEAVLASHGALSLDPVASRAWDSDHMLCLESDNPTFCTHSQYDIDGSRDADEGCSACVLIAATWILDALRGVEFKVLSSRDRVNNTVLSGVQAWDTWQGDRTGGVAESVLHKLSSDNASTVHVDCKVVLNGDKARFASLLEEFQTMGRVGALVTIPDEGNHAGDREHTGKSFACVRDSSGYVLMDSHRHSWKGKVFGTMIYSCATASEIAEFCFSSEGLFQSVQCNPAQLDVAVVCDVQELILADANLSLVKAAAQFYPRLGRPQEQCDLMPGDYPQHDYDHNILHQLLSYGMKLHSVQEYMFANRPVGDDFGGLVAWAMDALMEVAGARNPWMPIKIKQGKAR